MNTNFCFFIIFLYFFFQILRLSFILKCFYFPWINSSHFPNIFSLIPLSFSLCLSPSVSLYLSLHIWHKEKVQTNKPLMNYVPCHLYVSTFIFLGHYRMYVSDVGMPSPVLAASVLLRKSLAPISLDCSYPDVDWFEKIPPSPVNPTPPSIPTPP